MNKHRCSHSLKSGKKCTRYTIYDRCWQHTNIVTAILPYGIHQRNEKIKIANKELAKDKLKYMRINKKRIITFDV